MPTAIDLSAIVDLFTDQAAPIIALACGMIICFAAIKGLVGVFRWASMKMPKL